MFACNPFTHAWAQSPVDRYKNRKVIRSNYANYAAFIRCHRSLFDESVIRNPTCTSVYSFVSFRVAGGLAFQEAYKLHKTQIKSPFGLKRAIAIARHVFLAAEDIQRPIIANLWDPISKTMSLMLRFLFGNIPMPISKKKAPGFAYHLLLLIEEVKRWGCVLYESTWQ